MDTTTARRERRDHILRKLLSDFGYRVEGKLLISNAIRGFTSDRIVCQVRDLYDAAERLCPLLHDAAFTTRFAGLEERVSKMTATLERFGVK